MWMQSLKDSLDQLIVSPRLLVATDFDGTLAPICDHPTEAKADPAAIIALRVLSELPNTFVSIISGRALSDLRERMVGVQRARLVGSHGEEFDSGPCHTLTDEQSATFSLVLRTMEVVERELSGSHIEIKPHSVAFHYRQCQVCDCAQKIDRLVSNLSAIPSIYLRRGKMVIEVSMVQVDKGVAIRKIQQHLCPFHSFFIGDDVTDEDAFGALAVTDVGVKVGPGQTTAQFRIDSQPQVCELLVYLAEKRKAWFANNPSVEIAEHLLLSDLRVGGLLDSRGTINWLCFPRFDSISIFGSLVGGPGAGFFSIAPINGELETRSYLADTLVAETRWKGLKILDFFDCTLEKSLQRAGRSDLYRLLVGSGDVEAVLSPRLDFGRIPTRIVVTEAGLRIEGGTHPVIVHSPGWSWNVIQEGMHDTAIGSISLSQSSSCLSLHFGAASVDGRILDQEQPLKSTLNFWTNWLAGLSIPTPYSAWIRLSALVLKALTYGPSGSSVAAMTTSLPEVLGGNRNWDYRYCWPRDSSFAATSLVRLGDISYGMRFLDWILGIFEQCEHGEFLSPVYTVAGRHLSGEAEVSEAAGYRGSRPVRIGNLAAHQLQLDSLAPIIELMSALNCRGALLTIEHVELMERVVGLIEVRWSEADSGIWELRGPQRHYVHSKLMCWYAVTLAHSLIERMGFARPSWYELAEAIRADIETRGYSQRLGTYVCAYDFEEADAALLWIILSGFHPPLHERSLATLQYIEKELVRNGSVYRYRYDDSLSGNEGAFQICLSWYIQSLALLGKTDQAAIGFERLLRFSEPLGLLSEQWEPDLDIALGNFPQSYSHSCLIDAALMLYGPTVAIR